MCIRLWMWSVLELRRQLWHLLMSIIHLLKVFLKELSTLANFNKTAFFENSKSFHSSFDQLFHFDCMYCEYIPDSLMKRHAFLLSNTFNFSFTFPAFASVVLFISYYSESEWLRFHFNKNSFFGESWEHVHLFTCQNSSECTIAMYVVRSKLNGLNELLFNCSAKNSVKNLKNTSFSLWPHKTM